MKKLLLLISFFAVWQVVRAQDEAIFTHYHITPILINPAAAGFNNTFQLQMNGRAQWTGFADAPQTVSAMLNSPVGKNFGIGVGVSAETAAQLTRLKGQLNWAFRFNLSEYVKMSAGFSAFYQQLRLDNNADFGRVDEGDNVINDYMNGVNEFDASIGVFGSIRDNTRFGLSFANLIQSRLDDVVESTDESALQHYTLFLAHRFDIYDLNFSLEPSIMARRVKDAPAQVDINLKATFLEDQLITGVSYRSLGALGILLGAKISNFNVLYSYDMSFQRFQKFNSGSHEISLLFNLVKKNPTNQRANQ
ncbi:MAG: PorP/SprF family type IX secretion system membrane protein [Saprospiraceae bacterium]